MNDYHLTIFYMPFIFNKMKLTLIPPFYFIHCC